MTIQFVLTASLFSFIGYLPTYYLIDGQTKWLRAVVMANATFCTLIVIACALLAIWL